MAQLEITALYKTRTVKIFCYQGETIVMYWKTKASNLERALSFFLCTSLHSECELLHTCVWALEKPAKSPLKATT